MKNTPKTPVSKTLLIISMIFTMPITPLFAESWVFTAWGDPHRELADFSGNHPSGTPAASGYPNATGGLNGTTAEMQQMMDDEIALLQSYNSEAMIIVGDIGKGHFDKTSIRDVFAPGGTIDQAIQNAGEIYWGQFKYWFTNGGFSNLMVAVGDHELGDNPWPEGTTASQKVPVFRSAFASAFNKDSAGNYLVTKWINGVNPRPVGTPYEGTSYAQQVRNVLFITLDVFRQDDPDIMLDEREGSILGDISGAHLDWLGALLTAADADATIDHIILQGHNPVIDPVRKRSSSGGMMHHREDGEWWQRVRQSTKVRAYLAGEVHEETVTKDPGSDILQIVIKDYLVVTVDTDTLAFEHHEFKESINANSQYWSEGKPRNGGGSLNGSTFLGSLSADYSGTTPVFVSSGRLQIINPRDLAINYSFDETDLSTAYNSGMLGDRLYSGEKTSVAVGTGILGNAAVFSGDGRTKTAGIFQGGMESKTLAAWIKTGSTARMNIMAHGKPDSSYAGAFNVGIKNGRFGVWTDADSKIVDDVARAKKAPVLSDNTWHHVAVVVRGRDWLSKLKNLQFFVDGIEYSSSSTSNIKLYTTPGVNSFYVGTGADGAGPNFSGKIDDVAVWATALTPGKVKALHNIVEAGLSYNAAAMQELYHLYDDGAGERTIGSETWYFASGLVGAEGEVSRNGGNYTIVLDSNGNGVTGW